MAIFKGIIIKYYVFMICIDSIISVFVFGPHYFSKFEAASQYFGANRFIHVECEKDKNWYFRYNSILN